MKRIQKLASFLMKPRRRGFSRIDFFVLLFLAAATTVNVLVWTMQPAQPAAPVQAARATTVPTRSHTTALAIPQAPAAPVASRAARAGNHAGALALLRAQQAGPALDPCQDAFTKMLLGGYCSIRGTDCTGGNYVTNSDCIMLGLDRMTTDSQILDPFGITGIVSLVTYPYITVNQAQVKQLWQAVLDGVNAFCVVLLGLAGLRIMLGGSVFRYANAIEMIPGILLALIAAQLSMNLMTVCLAIDDYSTVALYNYASSLPLTQDNNVETQHCKQMLDQITAYQQATGGNALVGIMKGISPQVSVFTYLFSGCLEDPEMQASGVQSTLSAAMNPPNANQSILDTISNSLFGAASDPGEMMQYIVAVMIFMLLGQIIVRLLFLDFYIITAPIGIGASGWPGRPGQTVTRMWVQGFTSTLFSQFLQVVALIVMRILGGAITSAIDTAVGPYIGNDNTTFLWLVQIAQYWFILRIPSLLSTGPGSPMNMIVGFGQTVSQLVQMQMTEMLAQEQLRTSVITQAASAGIGFLTGFIR